LYVVELIWSLKRLLLSQEPLKPYRTCAF
jgi:hypothetical protein